MKRISDPKDNIIGALSVTIALLVVGYILVIVVGNALDRSIDNQNLMLCKSAKTSGNLIYLDKCEDYYLTGDIKSMRSK